MTKYMLSVVAGLIAYVVIYCVVLATSVEIRSGPFYKFISIVSNIYQEGNYEREIIEQESEELLSALHNANRIQVFCIHPICAIVAGLTTMLISRYIGTVYILAISIIIIWSVLFGFELKAIIYGAISVIAGHSVMLIGKYRHRNIHDNGISVTN